MKPPRQDLNQTAWQINVTDLTPSQRRELFKSCLNERGFTGFTRRNEGK